MDTVLPISAQETSALRVRYASIGDLPEIVEIYNSAIPLRCATADLEPVTAEQKLEWFRQHQASNRPLLVLECNAQVVGWAALSSFYGRRAYDRTAEVSLYIATEYQARGFGKHLLQAIVESCSLLGVNTLLAFVFSDNVPSIRLFEGIGFERWGLLRGVAELDSVLRDLLIFGKSLLCTNYSCNTPEMRASSVA